VACRCVSALAAYGNYLKKYHSKANFVFKWEEKAREEGRNIIDSARKEGRDSLLEFEAKRLLELHGAPILLERLAKTADEAIQIFQDIGQDVALKIVSPDILHKSDAGGVRTNLGTPETVRSAFDEILSNAKKYHETADIRGVLVSPMAEQGVEVIIGTKIDDQFGPVIMFGLGGVLVEILKDVSFRVLPISPHAARKMIEEIKASVILDGYRGRPPMDKKSLTKLLLTCSEVIEAYPDIKEMDLNPVMVYDEGVAIVDARIILKEVAK